jgi:phage-related protein
MDIIKALPGHDRPLKPLVWMGSSKKDLLRMAAPVIDVFGYAFFLAQSGGRHSDTKVLKGFGDASVIEVVASDRGAYRAVYTTRFEEAIVVLHVFQKKSKTGIATPKSDMAKVAARLKMASEVFRSSPS